MTKRKDRLYPTPAAHCELHRLLYNGALQERVEVWTSCVDDPAAVPRNRQRRYNFHSEFWSDADGNPVMHARVARVMPDDADDMPKARPKWGLPRAWRWLRQFRWWRPFQ